MVESAQSWKEEEERGGDTFVENESVGWEEKRGQQREGMKKEVVEKIRTGA